MKLVNVPLQRKIEGMTTRERAIANRLKELENSAQQMRLEAMRVGALLLAKMDTLLAHDPAAINEGGELAVLKARYDMLMRLASDAQEKIDKLHAEQHDLRYCR